MSLRSISDKQCLGDFTNGTDNRKIEIYEQFLNKSVVVVFMNGFKKAGLVTAIDSQFMKLRYNSGNEELINLSALKSIKVDNTYK